MIAVWNKEETVAGLDPLPGWALKLHGNVGRFSQAGLTGLVDHAEVTNRLGEMLVHDEVNPKRVQEFLDGLRKPAASSDDTAVPQSLLDNPRSFWAGVWPDILGEQVMRKRKIIVPPFHTLNQKMGEAITGGLGHWLPVFLPQGLSEEDYPADFIKPNWGRHLAVANIQRRPLPGRWVLVETTEKSNWDDKGGYGNGNDPLAQALGLTTRFAQSWDTLKDTNLPKVAKLLGLSKKAVRLPTAEEWNLIANLFNWLNHSRGMSLPDLGSTNSWEWCENTYGGGRRLVVGSRDDGGLAGVDYVWRGDVSGVLGFRVLAVL